MTNYSEITKLDQDLLLNLFRIELTNGAVIFICDKYQVIFLGDTYEFLPNELSGAGEDQGQEATRPTWTIANPNGIWTGIALSEALEGALVHRYQMKAADLAGGVVTSSDLWTVYQIMSVSTSIQLQLRTLTDIPPAQIPYRQYYPPIFPHVSN